jgi:putative nucleotidyltransferase with HDIG domain
LLKKCNYLHKNGNQGDSMDLQIPIINMVLSLSSAIDLINPNLSNHHKRVAYISYSIAKQMNFSELELKDIVLASLLHDCGAANIAERNLLFEFDYGDSALSRHSHGYKGWFILNESAELKAASEIIKFHHVFWEEQAESYMNKYTIPIASHVLHLADRVDILINRNKEILNQRKHISEMIKKGKGTMFMPEAVEAFETLVPKVYFWFDIVNPYLEDLILKEMSSYVVNLTNKSLLEFANIAHRIIDFRSKFTATHSIGVATSASSLALKLGLSREDCELMHCAGLMHDLGKLAIPENILEKQGPLDQYEYNIIKSHTYHTYRIIDSMPGLDKIRDWAAFHHEKLDGSGYPFGIKADKLDLGSRKDHTGVKCL